MQDATDALRDNPLLIFEGMPGFDRIRTEHIVPAVRYVIEQTLQKIDQLEQDLEPGWDSLVRELELLEVPFEYAWRPVTHLLGVKDSQGLRTAYETVQGEMVALEMRILQSRPIYDALTALKQSPAWNTFSEPQKRIVEIKIRDAQHAGIGLEDDARKRFIEIEQELSRIATRFSNNILDATKAFELIVSEKEEACGWPDGLKKLAAQSYNQAHPEADRTATPEEGPWRITLDHPIYLPFMQHSRNRGHREHVYRASITCASRGTLDNSAFIERILALRKEKAGLLGYPAYAELSLASKMAHNVEAVERMFDELARASRTNAYNDFSGLEDFAKKSGETARLEHWDILFWAERLRENLFDFTQEELRPYFPLERVLNGLFILCNTLFGIRVNAADGEAPVWHKDVRYFKVYHADSEPIASFYLDPYSRPQEKRSGAWMANCLTRRMVKERLQLPVIHLCCNCTPPVGDTPSLMNFDEIRTLFHEFGHGLQSMLTTVDYADVAGINGIEWDAVELASQFMENWCYHKPTLMGMSRHIHSGEPLPDELFEKILAARTYRSGSLMMRQLEYGMIDMALHYRHDPEQGGSPFDLQRSISEQMRVPPPLAEDRFLCSFAHIFAGGYAAGYYSYKWSEVLSADAFAAFEEAGLDNQDQLPVLGRRYRDTILASGGSRHPMDVFKSFRGREPSTKALLRHSGLIQPDPDGKP
ncbi:MAG: M3 family metallopeptidase [Deltaproteobacteria bacterium]|nr:M3 family metallopeptidase [Deltaproteobacteria bacterium]